LLTMFSCMRELPLNFFEIFLCWKFDSIAANTNTQIIKHVSAKLIITLMYHDFPSDAYFDIFFFIQCCFCSWLWQSASLLPWRCRAIKILSPDPGYIIIIMRSLTLWWFLWLLCILFDVTNHKNCFNMHGTCKNLLTESIQVELQQTT
jgi:hypothetical protein